MVKGGDGRIMGQDVSTTHLNIGEQDYGNIDLKRDKPINPIAMNSNVNNDDDDEDDDEGGDEGEGHQTPQ